MKTAATVALRSVPRAALALPPVWRRRAVAALATVAGLAALYAGWFRDSSFARVEKVQITGVSGPQARAIRSALEDAGLGMTTLHVRGGDLREAVSAYPVVRSVTASGDFPHLLRIDVQLNLPVAVLQTAAGRIPISADGLLLHDVPGLGLPTLAAGGSTPTDRVTAGRAFILLHVVSAAPARLRARIRNVAFRGADGLVVHMRRGPDLIFGTGERVPAKWIAAARVLSSPAARGASYIDLRLPERPAAGGLPTTSLVPLAPAGSDAGTTLPATGTSGPTAVTNGVTTTAVPAPATTTTTTTTTTAPATGTSGAAGPAAGTQTAPAATTGGGQQAPE